MSESPEFKSSEIEDTTARNMDPFKEHRAETAKKKQKDDKTRKQVLVVLGVTLAMVLIGLGIWWIASIMSRTEVEEDSAFWQTDESKKVQDTAQEIYDAGKEEVGEDEAQEPGGDDEATEEYFDEQYRKANTDSERNQVVLTQMIFYSNNARPEMILDTAEKIPDPEVLDDDDLRLYCGYIYNAAVSTGQAEGLLKKCEELINKLPNIDMDGEG